NDSGLTRDINLIIPPIFEVCPDQNDQEILVGFNDWSNIKFNFIDSDNFADGLHLKQTEEEISVQVFEAFKDATNNLNPIKDSFLTQGNAKENEGINPILRIISSDKNRPIIAFDQNRIDIAAVDETLQSATLRVYITDNGNNWGPDGRNIAVHRILEDWIEGNGWNTGNNISGNGTGTTWNCAIDSDISNNQDDCGVQWGGGNINSTATDIVLITNNMVNQFIEFDVTSDIQQFLGDTVTNHGWMIKKADEAKNGSLEFASKESGQNIPELILVFEGQ
ncbi:MAG: DNRLRE domain-containing protein, partial [Nitrosopumilaceae archaeon]